MTEVWDAVIVGAGMAGLAAAQELSSEGLHVLVIDKGRQVGGRMANRRFRGMRFDTAAQFFTALSEEFSTLVDRAAAGGVVAQWFTKPPLSSRHGTLSAWRGVDAMTDLPKWIAASLQSPKDEAAEPVSFVLSRRVLSVSTVARGFELSVAPPEHRYAVTDTSPTFTTKSVILTAPIDQSRPLVPSDIPLPHGLDRLSYHPALALLVELDEYPRGIMGEEHYKRFFFCDVEWIADNLRKGLKPESDAVLSEKRAYLTVHFAPEVSSKWYHLRREELTERLIECLVTTSLPDVDIRDQEVLRELVLRAAERRAIQAKKWRYARPVAVWLDSSVLLEPGIAIAGDTFGGPRVEGAFLSGVEAARSLRETYLS
ncbi:MAG: FAD-dependent oxidoreductase [Spirochaetales bacterium]|nr:FAD-dependent oxidoreductase [Spirochaetales bacterium]